MGSSRTKLTMENYWPACLQELKAASTKCSCGRFRNIKSLKLPSVTILPSGRRIFELNTQILHQLWPTSLCTKLLSARRTSSLCSILEMHSGRRRLSPGSAWWRGGCWGSCTSTSPSIMLRTTENSLPRNTMETCGRSRYHSLSKRHQLRFDPRRHWPAYENDILQAGADNDRCTWATAVTAHACSTRTSYGNLITACRKNLQHWLVI